MTEQRVDVPGGHLAWEGFGSPDDPVVLLIAGQCQSMTWWEAAFCELLAAEGRFVVRYDHRDTGRSSTDPAGRPTYSGRELVLDPIRLLDAIGASRAHVVGLSAGGGIAQDLALAHPERLSSLTLIDTSPVRATGLGDLPPPVPALMRTFENPEPTPDWSDRDAVIDYRVAIERPYAGTAGLDEDRYRRLAVEEVDRSTDMEVTLTNHLHVDDWSPGGSIEEIAVSTLVLHGTADPLFPLPHGEALRDAIPGARLVVLDGGHQQPPPEMWDLVVGELTAHTV